MVDNSINDVGEALSLALDASNNPQIAYYDNTSKVLQHTSINGSGWSITIVYNTMDACSHPALVLKSNGNALIGYYDATNGDLKFAEWSGTQ